MNVGWASPTGVVVVGSAHPTLDFRGMGRLFIAALMIVCSSALAADPFETFRTIPNGLGVNIHFTHPKKGELEQLAGAGFKLVRMDFTWSATEKDDRSYDFS